jgi:hypothetical protein
MEEETFCCFKYDSGKRMLRHKGNRARFPKYQTWEWGERLADRDFEELRPQDLASEAVESRRVRDNAEM